MYRRATVIPAAGSPAVLGVYGRVQIPPVLTITPDQANAAVDPYDFGQVVVNTDHNKSFTVTNTGETTSAAVTMTLTSDTSGGRFNIGGACTATLAAGASCIGNITYSAPTAPSAAVTATLRADAGPVSSAPVTLTARPLNDTTLTVSPTTLSFPTQSVGTTSTAQVVTLTNANNSTTSGLLTIAVADTTNFSISVNDGCPVYTDPLATTGLPMNGRCQVSVTFTPKTLGTGTFETDLTIRATPGSLKTIHITGVSQSALHIANTAPIIINPATYTIDAPYDIMVYLDAGAPLTSYVQTSITGGNYAIVEDQCVATKLTGSDACLIKVAPLFTAATPNKTATLTVNGGVAGNSATATLNSTTP
jgi:hypothetical protein